MHMSATGHMQTKNESVFKLGIDWPQLLSVPVSVFNHTNVHRSRGNNFSLPTIFIIKITSFLRPRSNGISTPVFIIFSI